MNSLTENELKQIDAYWRAANYLSVGQIYLLENPLLRKPLKLEHVKPRLLGHFGTTPGLNLVYVHLNRLIKKYRLNMINVTGPGHGAPGILANTYLEGAYSEHFPEITEDEAGLLKFFKQFSFPGGIPSHTAASTPGSIHEGGELGYCLAHAYGAAFDNPDLIVTCVVGDGEAETGPLAASWHSNKFLNPVHDGAVLPILHLNGYKIAEPTVLARIPKRELKKLFEGYGYRPVIVSGSNPLKVHAQIAQALEDAVLEIREIQTKARTEGFQKRPMWPMIILETPKGWTGPRKVDGVKVEGTFRSHQVPLSGLAENPKHLKILEKWLKSYGPEELFDSGGTLKQELKNLVPEGHLRLGANAHANGGLLLKDLKMPNFKDYAVKLSRPGDNRAESTRHMGMFLRDVMKQNADAKNFRVFGPDETASNRLSALFEVTGRTSVAEIVSEDDHVSPDGRVMEVLSEHLCQGWLEGYLLTGRHGLFSCYEAFIHIIDSMFNQYAKWLGESKKLSWRKPIASLNYLLTSHVWRQDHNGFSHQDPGFLDHVLNKKSDVVRIYLAPDANTLLSVTDHCLRSRNYINVIVAGKQPEWQWLDIESAQKHCEAGLGVWPWASHDEGKEPDVVIACAGDVPTLEALAATDFIRKHIPELRIRFVNVVNLMRLYPQEQHPHGLSDAQYRAIFPEKTHVIFAFHGYPSVIHRLTYKRQNYEYLHVHGFGEEGTTTTPFDMTVLNRLDRFHLAENVVRRVSKLSPERKYEIQQILEHKLAEHRNYICEHGEDMPEVKNWRWEHA